MNPIQAELRLVISGTLQWLFKVLIMNHQVLWGPPPPLPVTSSSIYSPLRCPTDLVAVHQMVLKPSILEAYCLFSLLECSSPRHKTSARLFCLLQVFDQITPSLGDLPYIITQTASCPRPCVSPPQGKPALPCSTRWYTHVMFIICFCHYPPTPNLFTRQAGRNLYSVHCSTCSAGNSAWHTIGVN